MVGGVPAPVCLIEGDSRAAENLGARQDVFVLAVAAHGDYMGVLDKQQNIPSLAEPSPIDVMMLNR
jgi:hypothetical protein